MKKTIYSTGQKKSIGLIFILLGTICAIDAMVGVISMRTNLFADYAHYSPFIEIFRIVLWVLLALVLKRIERIAAILKAAQLLLMPIVLPVSEESMALLIKLASVAGILAYVLFVMSKSLSPFKIPAITYLITTLWYAVISAFAQIPGLEGATHLLPITRLFYLAGGIITIASFCKWNYDEPTHIYINE